MVIGTLRRMLWIEFGSTVALFFASPLLQDQTPSWAKASALAKDWELNRLAERLAALAP